MPHDFRYSPDYESTAEYSEMACDLCGRTPALEAIYFGNSVDAEAVCIECLRSGIITVEIPSYLNRRLEESIRSTNPEIEDAEVVARIAEAVDELSRTPPVPWIQHNYWPVCHGDFARYLGEWSSDTLSQRSHTGDGLEYLLSFLDPFPRESIGDVQALWQSVQRKETAIYVFECFKCSRLIAIAQSY